MLRLNRYVLALALWISFLFNIERLDIDHSQVIDVASPVYVVAAVMVVVGLVLPQWIRTTAWSMNAIAVISFIIVKVAGTRPILGDGFTYVSLFELGALAITVTLAYMVGHLTADFVDTVGSLLFSDMADRIYPPEEAPARIKREMQYSRRATYPLSVMVFEVDAEDATAVLHATALEIQRLLVKRYSLVSLGRLFAWRTRRTDFVVDQSDQGRLVLVAHTAGQDNTDAIVGRLEEYAQEQLGVNLQCGVASFPDEEVTFEGLIQRAEQNLRLKTHPEQPDIVIDRRQAVAGDEYLVSTDGQKPTERRNARPVSQL